MLVSVNYTSREYQPPRVAGVSLNGKRAGSSDVAVIPYLVEPFGPTWWAWKPRTPWDIVALEQCFI